MTRWILARLGFAVIDLDAVARSLASKVLQDFDPVTLDQLSCTQFFKTRYMRLSAEYGLPADAVDEVASRSWAIVAKARDVPVNVPPMVELYD